MEPAFTYPRKVFTAKYNGIGNVDGDSCSADDDFKKEIG